MYSIARRRGGVGVDSILLLSSLQWSHVRSILLILAMEEVAYSSSPPCEGGGGLLLALHHAQEYEKYNTYLIARRKGGKEE